MRAGPASAVRAVIAAALLSLLVDYACGFSWGSVMVVVAKVVTGTLAPGNTNTGPATLELREYSGTTLRSTVALPSTSGECRPLTHVGALYLYSY